MMRQNSIECFQTTGVYVFDTGPHLAVKLLAMQLTQRTIHKLADLFVAELKRSLHAPSCLKEVTLQELIQRPRQFFGGTLPSLFEHGIFNQMSDDRGELEQLPLCLVKGSDPPLEHLTNPRGDQQLLIGLGEIIDLGDPRPVWSEADSPFFKEGLDYID